jgi:hypothetical protein
VPCAGKAPLLLLWYNCRQLPGGAPRSLRECTRWSNHDWQSCYVPEMHHCCCCDVMWLHQMLKD